MKKILFSLLAISAGLLSCQKDISYTGDTPDIGTPIFLPAPVTASVTGVVVDENNTPVANAEVRLANTVYTTNNKGFFMSRQHSLDKNISTVKVTSPGYFTAYRSFSATATRNYVTIKLIPKTLAGTFTSTGTGQITLANGSGITFQANAVNVKSTGTAYTGTVNVYASYIDPTASDFPARMPGSLMAEDVSNFYVLRSTGMMAVELESPSGEPLQLAASKPATMKMTIPSSLVSQAPSVIDTWSLDERGIWIKEGVATKNGSAYDFPVSHFSFWNCDIPTSAVYLTLNIKDQNNNPLINAHASLTSSTTFGTTGGNTDSLGNVSGYVPKNEAMTLKVYANALVCSSPVSSQQIGPYSVNSSQNVSVTLTPVNTLTVSGTAVNCASQPVTNGTAVIYNGTYVTTAVITNGAYSIAIPVCAPVSSVDVIVIDNTTFQQSTTATVAVVSNNAAAGQLSACGIAVDEFVNYILDGTTYSITSGNINASFNAFVSGSSTFISAYDQANSNWLSMGISGAATGTFPVSADSVTVNNFNNVIVHISSTATITAMGAQGQFIEGTFNVPFEATGSVHSLTGAFRIRRD